MLTSHRLDTVGVAGSIPVEPTILKLPNRSKTLEIPSEFDVVPAIDYRDGHFRLFRVLTPKPIKKCEKSVKPSRTKSRSA